MQEIHISAAEQKSERLGGNLKTEVPMGELILTEHEQTEAKNAAEALFQDAGLDLFGINFADEETSGSTFAERCIGIEAKSRIFEYESTANKFADKIAKYYLENKINETNEIDWALVKQAMIASDIGKSGPREANLSEQEAFLAVFSIERVGRDDQGKPVSEFVKYHFSGERQDKILQTLKKFVIDPDKTTISEFWDKHINWSHDILSHSNFPPKAAEAADFHHLFRGLHPGYQEKNKYTFFNENDKKEVAFDTGKKWVILLDIYEAMRTRSGLEHAETIKKIEAYLKKTAYAEDLEFRNLLGILGRACAESPDEPIIGAAMSRAA